MIHTINQEAVREAFSKPWNACDCLIAEAVELIAGEPVKLALYQNYYLGKGPFPHQRRFEVSELGAITAREFDGLHPSDPESNKFTDADREAFIATFPREIEIWEVESSVSDR